MPKLALSRSLRNPAVWRWVVAALSLMLVSGALLAQSQLRIGRKISAARGSPEVSSLAMHITTPYGKHAVVSAFQ